MTLWDWMDMLRMERNRLVGRGWSWSEPDELGRRELRDAEGYCPLCALATLHGVTKYKGAWNWALTQAFGLTVAEVEGARKIACAADTRYASAQLVTQITKELNEILEPANAPT